MKLKTVLLTAAGLVLLALGAVGAFIPVWPTTPFVICAAGCLSAAPKLRARIMKIRFFREYIEHYRNGKQVSRRAVASSLIFLWSMLAISAIAVGKVWVICILAMVGLSVSVHILWIARPTHGAKARVNAK